MVNKKNRSPIFQYHVNEYLLITLISFAASVSFTRLFLEVTGYPQLGGGELHIAHVLWGGLLLFIGSLLPLIFSNRWALDLSALLSGVGIGLFIDEVGKFITQTNDYFYPSAAPIIYAFFLLTALLYVRVSREREKNARIYMYHVFHQLEELLDNDLSIKEHRQIIQYLEKIRINNEDEQITKFADVIKEYLKERESYLIPHIPGFREKWKLRLRVFEAKWFGKQRMRMILVSALVVWGVYTVLQPWAILRIFDNPEAMGSIIENLISKNLVRNQSGLTWFQAKIGLEGTLGFFSILSGMFIFLRKERIGVNIGIATMLIMMGIANLILFYFDQFSTIINASVQFLIFISLARYRKRFLVKDEILNEPIRIPDELNNLTS
ncbi:MAG TPA: hypothetical protein VK856_00810 [Anaerolineaceae bacterium]|nr:hypothetical protein [Anaerolineaceae bacterium]